MLLLQVVDPDGNLFSVDVSGSSHVMLARGEGEEEATPGSASGPLRRPVRYHQHAPRFFVIHPDGSATEFLRYQVSRNYYTCVITANLLDKPSLPWYRIFT